MSVISRIICLAPRMSLAKPNTCVSRGFIRHFQRKSKPTVETKSKSPIEKDGVKLEREFSGVESHDNMTPKLAKYYLYAAAFVPSAFVGCMIWQYETYISKRFRDIYHHKKEMGIRDHLNLLWNNLNPGKKMILGILAANTFVFCMWQLPALTGILSRYFTCLPVKGVSVLAATLSGFSHMSGLHLFINMYVLWSFAEGCMHLMNREQLLALYLSGITISSLTSATFRYCTKMMIPSVGASGGILTLIAFVCLSRPDSRISIAFVDQIIPHSFSAKTAIYGVMALDIIGLVLKWRMLDHAGHLGGVLFGLWYAAYGQQLIWQNLRNDVCKWWHSIRSSR